MPDETQAAKKPKVIKTKPAPKPKKKVDPKVTGCLPLEDGKVYKLKLRQRAALKPKGVSIDTIPVEMTGKDLNIAMKRIKANYVTLGIEK